MAAAFRPADRNVFGALLDRAGICVSAICLVQCLTLALAVVLAPFASLGVLGSDVFHRLLLLLIVPLSLAAFGLGYRSHRSLTLLLMGLAGLAILLASAVLEATVLPPLAAAALTSVGGLVLITGHWLNLRRRRGACDARRESAGPVRDHPDRTVRQALDNAPECASAQRL